MLDFLIRLLIKIFQMLENDHGYSIEFQSHPQMDPNFFIILQSMNIFISP